jgi:mitogen-activated protein kinase kinase
MERENSVNGLLPDLDRLSLEKGRPLDVDDLDDEGWHAASEQNKIVELGSLGEVPAGPSLDANSRRERPYSH